MGLTQETINALQRSLNEFMPTLNNIVLFFLILFIGFLVGKIAGRLVRRLLSDIKADVSIRRIAGGKLSLEKGASALASFLIYAASIILALNAVGLTTTVLEIILAILVLAILVSAFLALRDVIPNLAQGLALHGKLKEGDAIRLEHAEGVITAISLLETSIMTKNGDTIIVPNALFARTSVRVKRRRATSGNGGEQ